MSTDLPEGNEPQRGSTGRPPRVGDSRSPVGSTLSIVLAVIAVVAGFLILRELTDDDDPATSSGAVTDETGPDLTLEGGSTVSDGSGPAAGGATSTTAPPRTLTGAMIAVANASGVQGSALAMSTALTTEGYAGLGEPGNSTGEDRTETVVYYVPTDAAAQAVARTLARDLGGVSVEPMPATRAVDGGDTATATVLVMLGTDTAGKSISELSASTVSAPAVGGTTATTGG